MDVHDCTVCPCSTPGETHCPCLHGRNPEPETDAINVVARVLMDAWEKAEGKPVSVSYVATFADMARAVLNAAPLAVAYQSPNGTSLTRCCCDRTTARLVVCPLHPEAHVLPPDATTQEASRE